MRETINAMVNRLKSARLIAILLAGLVSLGAARTVIAQEKNDERRPLVFAAKEKGRVFQACDRAVRINLNGPATVGDIEQVCACVDAAFAASEASIPEEFRTYYFWQRPEGEVLNLTAINSSASGERVPGKARIVARTLSWEVYSCLARLPFRDQLTSVFARDWTDSPNVRQDYSGPIVEPREGPAGPVDKNLGGLLIFRLQHVRHVLAEAYLRSNEELQIRVNKREADRKFIESFHPGAAELVVLKCQYRTQSQTGLSSGIATMPYFYWYQPQWNSLAKELVKALPSDHPVREVGAPRDTCPLRQPDS